MEGKFDRRIRSQREREIYRPGSGPLKRTDPNDSKGFVYKYDYSGRSDNSRNGKDDYDADRMSHESNSYNRYEPHSDNKSLDKDKKKTRKPDAGIYVPKQRTRADGPNPNESNFNSTSHGPLDNQKLPYSSRDGLTNRENEPSNNYQYDSHHQSRVFETKQFTRGYKNDNQSNWKDYSKENADHKKFDSNRDSYDSQNQSKAGFKNNPPYEDRNTYYNSEHKGQNNYRYGNESFNDKYRNDRGNNDKNRSGRSLPRRNSSNSISLPDAYSSWPPRLQRQYLDSRGIKPEDAEKYLKSKQQQQFVGNSNRDNRYSQTLPPKNNRNSHFKMNNKENPRNNRFFQKPKPFDERPGTDQSGSSEEKSKPFNVDSSELTTSTEKSWNSNESVQEPAETRSDSDKKSNVKDEPAEESQKNDIKDIIETNDEDFNWAEEVEREQLYVERNLCEADDYQKNDDNSTDKKKDRKKRRRREFRKRRGFSFERKQPQRSRNPSEGENQNRRRDDDYRHSSRSTNEENRNESSNNDGYLSWRRNKNPSPSRTRLGIMGRNYRSDNKSDSFRNNTNDHEKISNKIKINNKINELPAIVRDQTNANSDNIAGIIKIPQTHSVGSSNSEVKSSPPKYPAPPSYPVFPHKPVKQLYNPTNPKQPIIVSNQSSRAAVQSTQSIPSHYPPSAMNEHSNQMYIPPPYCDSNVPPVMPPMYMSEAYTMNRPAWYDAYSKSFRSHNNAHLLLDISMADNELQALLLPGAVIQNWERISVLRGFLQRALHTLLATDLKFCEAENVEQHMWKILFHNVIELLRKSMIDDPVNAHEYKSLLHSVIDQGTEYFNSLLNLLESVHNIKINNFLNAECPSTKGMGLVGLALVSAQKIFLFLGDLARYKETSEESSSFINARQWYIKANQLNPRNGKPYHQLALLAVCGRKKFDAVYYYMRSLMASNPFFTARDSLLALFDENRKKYEQVEKMRREIKEIKKQEKAKEKESVINGSMLRKEIWIRPDDGRRIQRTTSTSQECNEESDDELLRISAAEVNKRFLVSFLHVHGKLFCKVGMETLQEAAIEMLTEFKVLLSHTPLPVTTSRLLQLLALNMFAIDNGQLKDPQLESGYHSAVQESALVISFQMFNIIVNRCIQLLREQLQQMKEHADVLTSKYPLIVHSDVLILLPAVKLWCDWLFCHGDVWNPPPSCQDYRISGCGDCWSALATFINLLEELNYQDILEKSGFTEPILVMPEDERDYVDMVKITLEEDVTLSGFTPLMYNTQPVCYTYKNIEMELAQVCLRIHRILFFGTVFLCGIDPPVLKLHKTETGLNEYISVVEEVITPKDQSDNENVEDHWSEVESDYKNDDDEPDKIYQSTGEADEKGLLYRKKELERIHQKREKYIRDKKETINKELAAFSVEMEIKPHYLVPDTNCFIDCLSELEKIVKAVSVSQRPLYSLMVPVIVLSELEGIARGARKDEIVSEKARFALKFLQNRSSCTNIKCVTTRGSVLTSTRFTSEEDYSKVEKNDDKILTTCMNLCKNNAAVDPSADPQKKIYREVVLLTEDRNLRVKALSSNMPVQTVIDFIKWADLN